MKHAKGMLFAALLAVSASVVWLGLNSLADSAGPWGTAADRVSIFATIFLGIFIEAAPFLLMGTVASGLVEVFVNKDQIARYIPRDPIRGAIAGSLLGLFFPVCECGVVPLTRRLFTKGLPVSVGIAFLLAGPAFNPIVIAATAAAFGVGHILALRLGLTLLIAVLTALVFAAHKNPMSLLLRPSHPPIAGASGNAAAAPVAAAAQRPAVRAGLRRALIIAADEFFEMGRFLVAGSMLAAFMQTVVPQSALLGLGSGPVVSVVTLIALAVLLSICSTVDSFIALSFAGTFSTGAILAFLVYGPMVDIKSTLMYLSVFRRRTVVYLVTLPLLLTLIFTIFINLNTNW